jgi:hypothetical protein
MSLRELLVALLSVGVLDMRIIQESRQLPITLTIKTDLKQITRLRHDHSSSMLEEVCSYYLTLICLVAEIPLSHPCGDCGGWGEHDP